MRKIYFIFLSLCLAGCSTATYLKTVDSKGDTEETKNTEAAITATVPAKIEIYCIDSISREYKIIGKVMAAADAGEDAKTSVDALKEQAAVLGADAIVNFRLEFTKGYWSAGIKSSGTAVKYITK